MVKNWLAIQETRVQFLGWEDPWRRAWQPIPVFLPGRIPWTEGPSELQSMGSQRVGLDLLTKWASVIAQLVKNLPAMQETPVRFLGQEDLLEKG